MDITPSGLFRTGETSSIVNVLKRYGVQREVPIDFVARSVGRRTDEIAESLRFLSDRNIVSCHDDSVKLITE